MPAPGRPEKGEPYGRRTREAYGHVYQWNGQRYERVRGPQDDPQLASSIDTIVRSPQLVIEADGQMVVIPMSSILHFEISPSPRSLPSYAIRGAARAS